MFGVSLKFIDRRSATSFAVACAQLGFWASLQGFDTLLPQSGDSLLPLGELAAPVESEPFPNEGSFELAPVGLKTEALVSGVLHHADSLDRPTRPSNLVYQVKPGDTLSTIWSEYQAPAIGAFKAAQALSKAPKGSGTVRSGEELRLTLSGSGDIVEVRRSLPKGAELVLSGDSRNGYEARVVQPLLTEHDVTARGLVTTSFASAAAAQGVPSALIDDFVDLFSNRVEFRKDISRGDSFSVIYAEHRDEQGRRVDHGEIKAASMRLGGKFFAVVRDVASDGTVRYFDEKGELPGSFFLRYPLQFSRISSTFANARFHPVLQRLRAHNGVDFAAPIGTPVRSVGDGTVVASGYSKGPGNLVRIQHSNRYTTEYMHLARIAPGLKIGSKVSRGEIIGAVGMTGMTTGPHLHFGLFDNGKYVDPLSSKTLRMPQKHTPPVTLVATLQELERHHLLAMASNGDTKPRV
jgi:murein DD-endopeptidase MepM/ murein hydrolase activator NlpD